MRVAHIVNGVIANISVRVDGSALGVGELDVTGQSWGIGWVSDGNGGFSEPPTPVTPQVYTKLAIRRAMRSLGTEAQLDALLDASPMFRADWTDATEIDLADPVLAQALAGAEIDVEAVKGALT